MIKQLLVLQRLGIVLVLMLSTASFAQAKKARIVEDFNKNWNFKLGDHPQAINANFSTTDWRTLQLPHDWSIEGAFNKDFPTGTKQGFLPAGKGWYRKTFTLPKDWAGKSISIEFDGVFKNSEVFINGHSLRIRPSGYISFAYEMTPYLHFGKQENVIVVKVDNDAQPNSRWYTGSGIYRNVRLVAVEKLHVAHWGTYVTTPKINKEKASVHFEVTIENKANTEKEFKFVTSIVDAKNKEVANAVSTEKIDANSKSKKTHNLEVKNPNLW
ncbi:MAG TPA: glycoside hydrolase family 2, partial [Flavobacterium sp.]|uniref:sugar-binding domain-containing protein n=1 Tax=Flavobacterium sp. TaxID=239 RepID=UPI002ED1A3FD